MTESWLLVWIMVVVFALLLEVPRKLIVAVFPTLVLNASVMMTFAAKLLVTRASSAVPGWPTGDHLEPSVHLCVPVAVLVHVLCARAGSLKVAAMRQTNSATKNLLAMTPLLPMLKPLTLHLMPNHCVIARTL